MDILPWKWRYDYFGAIVRDYFGVQPLIKLIGTNACYAMAEYRTCTNGATLWQVKNYLYDRFQQNGGAPQTFTIQSSLFTGKTIRAFEQGRIIETNSDGIDQHDAGRPTATRCCWRTRPARTARRSSRSPAAPSVVHPGGDKVYQVKAQYDCAGTTNLKLKVAFKEVGDNGDGVTNEIYAIVDQCRDRRRARPTLYLWIPPYRQNDTDYKSTPDGGKYEFAAWLENAGGVKVAQSIPRPTIAGVGRAADGRACRRTWRRADRRRCRSSGRSCTSRCTGRTRRWRATTATRRASASAARARRRRSIPGHFTTRERGGELAGEPGLRRRATRWTSRSTTSWRATARCSRTTSRTATTPAGRARRAARTGRSRRSAVSQRPGDRLRPVHDVHAEHVDQAS